MFGKRLLALMIVILVAMGAIQVLAQDEGVEDVAPSDNALSELIQPINEVVTTAQDLARAAARQALLTRLEAFLNGVTQISQLASSEWVTSTSPWHEIYRTNPILANSLERISGFVRHLLASYPIITTD